MNMRQRLAIAISLIAFGVIAQADDTEIYLGSNQAAQLVRPNITFIIDTSGSMGSEVVVTVSPYDPSQTYTGTCTSDRVYWSSNGTPPTCSTSQYVAATSFVCADADSGLSGTSAPGYYTGTLARYRPGRTRRNGRTSEALWSNLRDTDHTSLVECAADFGVHGQTAGSTDVYPANENDGGPFIASSTNAIDWTRTGASYTVYSANYLNWRNGSSGTTTMTRLQVVQNVLSDLVDSTSGVNAALMRFDSRSQEYNKGGYFLAEMQNLTDASRTTIKNQIAALTDQGYTPLSETLYEAALYYRGDSVLFGNSTQPGTNVAGVLQADGTTYNSPINYECQKNFIVLLTDGQPTYDTDADSAINALTGFSTLTGGCGGGDDCLDELAQYLNEVDQSDTQFGSQTVQTYTIGFTTDQQLLSDTASKGGGRYYTADDVTGLTDAFTGILTEILAVNTSFLAPAVPVNAFNQLTHDDSLFFALFRPQNTPRWPGNLKRYKLDSVNREIVDVNGDPAIDATTGFFKSTSTSFWTTDGVDGDNVAKGGAASQLTTVRNLYTYVGSNPTNISLTAASRNLHENNTLITLDVLGIPTESADYRTQLLQWARGIDVLDEDEDGLTDDARKHMGDPLHGSPVPVNYAKDTTNNTVKTVMFTNTNEGFLHAVNASTTNTYNGTAPGGEYFAFMPQELLPNLNTQFVNSRTVPHTYGLDGLITAWVNDVNGNGVIEDASGNVESGEHVYLYMGMRRGGRSLYSLDVTNLTAPVLKWQIDGGSGDFTDLGQTWGRSMLAKVNLGGTEREVLFFAGGYDPDEDNASVITASTMGNAIYMVDANTGTLLWWAGGTSSGASKEWADLTNSIPGGVLVLDTTGDGYANLLVAADTAGQVWRFDFNNEQTSYDAATFASGGVIGSFGGATAATARRFFYRPDVSLIRTSTGSYALAIGVGSGFRAHPLETDNENRFYMIFDHSPFSAPASYTAVTESNLTDLTTNFTSGDLSAGAGWFLRLEAGEKVLAESITAYGTTYFTTYTPNASAGGACSPGVGLGRLFAVNSKSGQAAFALGLGTISGTPSADEGGRAATLRRGGIPPRPSLVYPKDGSAPVVVVGTETPPGMDNIDPPVNRLNWYLEE